MRRDDAAPVRHAGSPRHAISRRALFPLALAPALLPARRHLRAQGERVELTYSMYAGATELPGWTAQVEVANRLLESQSIRLKVQQINATGWGEYYTKIVAQLAAGRAPDLGRVAESLMPRIVTEGQAVDLTTYLGGIDLTQYFESPFRSAAFRDGKHFGFPSGTYNMLLYYNKALFDAAGLPYPSADWTNATTFAQIREQAKALTAGEGGSKRFGFAAGPYMAFVGMYAASNGGKNVFNDDGTCALTSPEGLAVYQWFDAMLREDGSMPRPTDTEVISSLEMFRAGRIAMMVDGTWAHAVVREVTDFGAGIAAVPSGTGQAYSSQFVDSWVVWQGTDHPDEAWEAIKALNSKEALDALASAGVGGTPVLKSTFDELSDELIGPQFSEDDKAAYRGALEHGLSVPYNEFYQEADDKVNASMDEWLLGRISADEFAGRVCGIIEETRGG